jgi:hypothetical protein
MTDELNQVLGQIMKCLGTIEAKIESTEKQSFKITLALIGVIAAQIGVKVLGTPPLLDIATALAAIGAILLLGTVITGSKLIRLKNRRLSPTGRWLTIMMGTLILTQILVYFRDMGSLSPDVIYIARIMQNFAIIIFGWKVLGKPEIFLNEEPVKDCGLNKK